MSTFSLAAHIRTARFLSILGVWDADALAAAAARASDLASATDETRRIPTKERSPTEEPYMRPDRRRPSRPPPIPLVGQPKPPAIPQGGHASPRAARLATPPQAPGSIGRGGGGTSSGSGEGHTGLTTERVRGSSSPSPPTSGSKGRPSYRTQQAGFKPKTSPSSSPTRGQTSQGRHPHEHGRHATTASSSPAGSRTGRTAWNGDEVCVCVYIYI